MKTINHPPEHNDDGQIFRILALPALKAELSILLLTTSVLFTADFVAHCLQKKLLISYSNKISSVCLPNVYSLNSL